MADPVLWLLDDHTRAKHRILAGYLKAWLPVMGLQAQKVQKFTSSKPRLLIVDGFAGPGQYQGGEPGSPIIMLDTLLSHTALPSMSGVTFYFMFIEQDARRFVSLKRIIDDITLPSNIEVHMENGAFEDKFGGLVDEIKGKDEGLIPTFAFVDPFGYSTASMSLAGKFLDFPRSEALFFLPLSFIHRFVGREGQEAALSNLFNTDRWKEAIPLEGADRKGFLLDLFEAQLRQQGQVKHVTSFELRTRDGNDYRLVFATGHDRAVELMKVAMWHVDPVQGTRYVAHTESGQQVLFQPQVDTGPLLNELQATFGKKWFTIAQATGAMLKSPYLSESHLKRLTLAPAEKNGFLEVQRPTGRRAGTFTEGVKMRFT